MRSTDRGRRFRAFQLLQFTEGRHRHDVPFENAGAIAPRTLMMSLYAWLASVLATLLLCSAQAQENSGWATGRAQMG